MTATSAPRNILRDMIEQDIIKAGDALTFQFKSHVFRCVVTAQGFLGSCTRAAATPHRRAAPTPAQPIFASRGPFLSLTDWADTCIQEICHEYVTRFSSWKRCRHHASGQAMYVLRDKLQDSKRKPQAAPTHREVQRLHEKNAALQAEVANLKRKLEATTQLLLESQAEAEEADLGDASPTKRHRRCAGLMAL